MSPGNDANIEPAARAPKRTINTKSAERSQTLVNPFAFLRRNGREALARIGIPKLNTQMPNSPRIESALFNPPPIATAIPNVIEATKPENASRVPIATSMLSNSNDGMSASKPVSTADRIPIATPNMGSNTQMAPRSERKYVPSWITRPNIGE